MPNILVERIPEAEPRRFDVLSADIEAHGHNPGVVQVVQRCRHMEKRQNHTTTRVGNESERLLRETSRERQGRMKKEMESLRQRE